MSSNSRVFIESCRCISHARQSSICAYFNVTYLQLILLRWEVAPCWPRGFTYPRPPSPVPLGEHGAGEGVRADSPTHHPPHLLGSQCEFGGLVLSPERVPDRCKGIPFVLADGWLRPTWLAQANSGQRDPRLGGFSGSPFSFSKESYGKPCFFPLSCWK